MKSKASAQPRPFFYSQVAHKLNHMSHAPRYTDRQREVAFIVSAALEGRNQVLAATTHRLNRYAVQPGKIFGTNSKSPDKYKVVRLIADDVVVQNMNTRKTEVRNINSLLDEWDRKAFKEISFLEELIGQIKSVLGPFLGVFLTAALIEWLTQQVQKNQ